MPARVIRPPAVAGTFYPDDPRALRSEVHALLAANPAPSATPKAVIVPHAGYVYSGSIAARAYNAIAGESDTVRRVVLLGPAHHVPLRGLALPTAGAFATPLGEVPLDASAMQSIRGLPQVSCSDAAHRMEHSLEVQLPFLQVQLREFALVPLVVGWAEPGEVAAVLEGLWGGPETLIVISSDLSHYHPDPVARRLDADTARRIEALRIPIPDAQACGARPINGLLAVAAQYRLRLARLDLRNSADTAGDRQRVVGYGAWTCDAD
ncbi:MAG: AmmeMemoRadiSam system protein B [Gammaproteobacteria bacterium]